ncbi:IS256 family transposase [Geotoga petraea]|jgi:transposase-like protein|uniref:Mutator family transposase n=6 Tax=Geotoga petraea TaxID=28234 RepID=A0A4Z0VVZ3_9BACT|nr:IS256 family transposase [Geotoga petraea]TGG85787.1 IS256 family transposase [Geotoga petraea]
MKEETRKRREKRAFFKELIKKEGLKTIPDVTRFLKEISGTILEEMLEAELDEELGYEKYDRTEEKDNYRNGYTSKKVKGTLGEMELKIPRDRNGSYDPKIVPKYSKDISELEGKIIGMYGIGMTTRDISDQINEMYGFEVSADTISKITDKIIPLINDWQNRQLEEIYSFVFMDGIVYKVRIENVIKKVTVYVIIGVDLAGFKDVLGLYVGEIESAKYWLSVLNNLKQRGVKDILIASVDGLSGFEQAITTAFPKTLIQRCIIHQVRNSMRFVSYKDSKEFARDLKTVYRAVDEKTGYENLQELKNKWGDKYPVSLKSWEENWHVLSSFFQFSQPIRKIMYTTNTIESLNRQYRKYTKTKSIFPNEQSLMKMLYLATQKATKKWTARYNNWNLIIAELSIVFEDRLKDYIF